MALYSGDLVRNAIVAFTTTANRQKRFAVDETEAIDGETDVDFRRVLAGHLAIWLTSSELTFPFELVAKLVHPYTAKVNSAPNGLVVAIKRSTFLFSYNLCRD